MTFTRVSGALWSKRKASHEGFSLVAGAVRLHLAPHGGDFVAKKVFIMPFFSFLGSRMEAWCHPGKLDFSLFLTFLAKQIIANRRLNAAAKSCQTARGPVPDAETAFQ